VTTLAPLRRPAFRLLVAGRTISSFGSTFANIALAFAVLDLTGSATDLGLVVGTRTLINVIFLLFGGVLADRLPRHRLMVGAALLAGMTQATVATLVLTHTATVPVLIMLAAVNGMVSALSFPASAALLPQTVEPEERQQANALSRLLLNSAMIIGAPVGGVVVAVVGPGWGIAIDAASFIVAALCFSLVRVADLAPAAVDAAPIDAAPGAEPATGLAAAIVAEAPVAATLADAPDGRAEKQGLIADLRTGWTEFRSRTWLWVIVAGFSIVNASLSGGLNVLGPVVADDTFGRKVWGFILAAETAGMIVGGLVAMRMRVHRLLLLGTACTALEALPMLTLGTYPKVAVLGAAFFVAGLGVEQFGVAWETTVQEHVPADKLARVYSYDALGSFLAMPIGQVLAGPAAVAFGLEPALAGAAALVLVAVLGMLSSRDVRNLRHRLPEPAPAVVEQSPA
jgi:MFS family permease